MKQRFTKNDAIEFREICLNRIEEIDPARNAALALSGGTDSMTILFSMLETGRKPECYTFYMDGILSKDLKSSRYVCKHFGLNLHEIKVPSDVDSIYKDIKRVLPHCEYVKKTIIQCMIPWLYLYPAINCTTVINGIGGDDLYATQRKLRVKFAKFGDDAVLTERHFYGRDLRFSEANILRFAKEYHKENIDFYESLRMENFLNQFSMKAIIKPYDKYPSIAAFSDYYSKGHFYRDQTEHSYQINSKLRDCHDKLLKSKYNKNGSKAIIGIYNLIAKELRNERQCKSKG